MITKAWARTCSDSMWELGEKLGLSPDAIRMFRHAGCEVELTLDVDEKTGVAKIIAVDGRALEMDKSPQKGASPEQFRKASRFVMPFGKHKGKTLDEIAETDNGLKYLDWLNGITLRDPVKSYVQIYLSDPTIKKEMDSIT